jgi:hypothetical protein
MKPQIWGAVFIAILLLVLASYSLTGCEDPDQELYKRAQKKKNSYKDICVDGVTYIKYDMPDFQRGYFGITVKLDRNSKVILCK